MSGKNKSAYPFYIIAGSLVCLIAISLFKNTFSFLQYDSKPVDFLADVRPDGPHTATDSSDYAADMPADSTDLAADSTTSTADSAALARIPDPDRQNDFASYTGIMNYGSALMATDSTAQAGIDGFLRALAELRTGKRRKVRVAYFGDSMIEGDLITQDLRDSLQYNFGGAGVGFVPITSIVAGFRITVTHTFSKDWKDYSYKELPPSSVFLGISGHTFIPSAGSWVKYTPVKKRNLDRFQDVSVFYGPSASGTVSINDHDYSLSGRQAVNKLSLQQDSAHQSLSLKWAGGASSPFYGVSFEGDSGVYVDNFSFRGISGLELGKLSSQLLTEMQTEHPYDLVVFHYGANILWKPELLDYDWYGHPMKKVLDSLRTDWPATSFLVITTADKSYRKNGDYVTAPGVKALIKVQHSLAKTHGAGFWNLYAAMGGENSMVQWVQGEPELANKDYTHFNRQGAAKVGALLYKAMMNEYKQLEHQ
jgi:hypothetical protein